MERACAHVNVICLNPYEIIRKYRCEDCGEVIMCQCDEDFGHKFLPHQLTFGTELENQRPVKVTIGFQPAICRECRGLQPIAHPKAEIYGMTSKIRRYYWREIYMETTRRFADWAESAGYTDRNLARRENLEKYRRIENVTIRHFKELHRVNPKYNYKEKSQSEILDEHDVEVIELKARHTHTEEGNLVLVRNGELLSPEEYAQSYLRDDGLNSLITESIPFHVLFGVFMWILIQDPSDDQLQIRGFGRRDQTNEGESQVIHTLLPPDFGAPGYYTRRKSEIDKHLKELPKDRDELIDLFDYWLPHSEDIRQYLWAHDPAKVETARQLLAIIPPSDIISILEYLVADYWRRYVGWPDLVAYDDNRYIFVEVKSSGDRLSENQKNWIANNSEHLHLPFKLVKIHKSRPTNHSPDCVKTRRRD